MEQSSTPFQYLIDQQSQMLDNWTEMTKKMNENLFNGKAPQNGKAEGTPNPTEFFENWFKQQQEMAKNFWGMYDKIPGNNLFLFTPSQMKSQFDVMQQWYDSYKDMMKKAGIESPMLSMSNQVTQMGQQFDQFTKIYMQMMHFWEPFTQMVQKDMNVEKIMQEWMKPDAYHKMFDTMMGAMNMETVWEKASKLQEQFKGYLTQMMSGSPSELSEAMGMKPWFDMMQKVNEQATQNLAPFTQSLTRSRESEMLKLMQDLGMGFSDYSLKLAELQTNYYQTSYEALVKTVEHTLDTYKQDSTTLNYETFFKNYLDQLETALTAAFETDEYGKLQGEVAKAGAQLKHKMDKITELMFVGTPFTMRSQTEDVVAELQTLKRKVRNLEKKLAEAEEAKTPAKTTTARSKAASTAK